MTLLEDPRGDVRPDGPADPDARTEDAPTIDLTTDGAVDERADVHPEADVPTRDRPVATPAVVIDPSGRMPVRGMRIRKVRLASVAKLALVFHALGFAVAVGTLVAVWNVARAFGLVTSLEEMVITSLGLDAFEIDAPALFELVLVGAAVLAVLGWIITVLLAAVYNAACAVLGGLAVETGPLRRRRRVFSWRHRGFVTVRS